MNKYIKYSILGIGSLALVIAIAHQGVRAQSGSKVIRITYENLTEGQTFSPAVFFSHNSSVPPVFTPNEKASFGVLKMAEDGNTAPITDQALMNSKENNSVGSVMLPFPVGPGEKREVFITVEANHPLVSGIWMLGRTNDGFTGINAINMYNMRQATAFDIVAWDAGTEMNNEEEKFLPALMGPDRDPENQVITRHKGITGTADAPESWMFNADLPVARVTITPM